MAKKLKEFIVRAKVEHIVTCIVEAKSAEDAMKKFDAGEGGEEEIEERPNWEAISAEENI